MLALRIVVSAAMLAFLSTRVHLSSLLPDNQTSTIPWLVTAMAVWFVAVVASVVRWQQVLAALDLRTPLPPLLSHTLAGMFVANFLPSTVGGDVLRVMRLSSGTGEAPRSFASVVIDRLTGVLVLPLITLVALATHPALLHLGTASRLAVVLSLGSLAALAAVLAVAASPGAGGRLAGHESWLRFLGAVHIGVDRMRRRPAAVAAALGTALAYQLTVVVAAFAASRALGITVGWAPMLAFVPVVAIAQVLPISVGGLGLREAALVLLLHPLGVPTAKATALGLLLYAINLVVSLLGAPSFAVRSGNNRAAVSSR